MKRFPVAVLGFVFCFTVVLNGLAAAATTLRIAVPEHWQIVEPLKTNEEDKVVPRRMWVYEIVQRFKADHPDINLEFEAVPYDTITTSFVNKTMAGDPPDIQVVANGNQFILARAGYLYPLDGFEFPWSDFNPNIYKNNMQVDGKAYMMPAYTVVHAMYYNRGLFDEAGIADAPQTMEKLVAYGKKLTLDRNGDSTPEVWGFGLPASPTHPPFVYQNWETLVWLGGGRVAENGKALFDTDAARNATQFYADVVRKHKITPRAISTWDKEYMSQFRNERVAMTFRGAEEYGPAVNAIGEKAQIARIPVFKAGDPHYTWMEVFGWVMSATAGKDPAKRAAAWEFLKALVSEDAFVSMAKHQGGLPPRRSIADNPIYASNSIMNFQAQYAVDAGRADPQIENWEAWGDLVARTVQAAVLGLNSVDSLIKNAQQEYDARARR